MRSGIALLLGAAALLIGSVVAQANVVVRPMVRDDVVQGEGLPVTLAEFGFFTDAAAREPTYRVQAYELNTALYSDGADKLRYIYVPPNSWALAEDDGLLAFPVGSAIIKTFAFGEGEDQRFIETRVLLHRVDGWLALPYRWNEEQTEARLALAGGRVDLTTPQGEAISYRIPNKNQCKACHSVDGEVVPIGPKARNLSTEWLERMNRTGLLRGTDLRGVPKGADTMPLWHDTDATNEARARAYLDVNCAHCHRPGGGASNSGLDLRWEQDDPFAIGVNKPPVAAGRGAGGLLVSIAPGEPDKSILVHRMDSVEPGVAMPELGRATIDKEAVALMREWIAGMGE